MDCDLIVRKRHTHSTSKTILIIEDSKMVNNLLMQELSIHGHTLLQAFTLAEAHTYLKQQPELVILDLHLPDGEGKDFIPTIKQHAPNTKIIIFTADTDELVRYKLFNYGILDYYVKDRTVRCAIKDIQNWAHRMDYNRNFTTLIIDDSKTARMQLRLLLEPRNFKLQEASSGHEALAFIKENPVDLILLDMELPDINGLKVLEEIKAGQKATVPVIMISGRAEPQMVRTTYKLGASDFIQKPYIPEELLLKVDQWLDRYIQSIELACSTKLMEEHKDAIDESSIVSKTDLKGNITYVNEAFCQISGYPREELVGRPHNIIRHPDTDSAVFENLWQTIQSQKTWKGIIKNRNKKGGYYWVDTTIKPIVDKDGNIMEYIGIRKDISEIQELKEHLKNELNTTTRNFREAYHLSKEYEQAIDASNILSRTNLEGKITYVNTQFEQVTGYTREDVLGKTHKILHHPDTSKETITDLWQTIKSGNTWQGLIKNQKKDGNAYWVNTVILPIKDIHGNIQEYMSIRDDISEIMQLHLEIANTQKELIYRMGEIAESRSKETGNHIKRVAAYSRVLALAYGLGSEEADLLHTASPMHDIGKLAIPDAVLNKPGKLDTDEWEIMRKHSQIGHELLESEDKIILQSASIVAQQHHEKWNGTGYPQGLKGEEIHIFGRITAIADVFDALGSTRCYKPAWDDEKIFQLFRNESGKQFEPRLVELFFENLESILFIRDTFKDT